MISVALGGVEASAAANVTEAPLAPTTGETAVAVLRGLHETPKKRQRQLQETHFLRSSMKQKVKLQQQIFNFGLEKAHGLIVELGF